MFCDSKQKESDEATKITGQDGGKTKMINCVDKYASRRPRNQQDCEGGRKKGKEGRTDKQKENADRSTKESKAALQKDTVEWWMPTMQKQTNALMNSE